MTQYRTISIPSTTHRALKEVAEVEGISMSEMITKIVLDHRASMGMPRVTACAVDGLALSARDAGGAVSLEIGNSSTRLTAELSAELGKALAAALEKGAVTRRSCLTGDCGKLIQVAPRGRGVVVAVDGYEVAITTLAARELIDDLAIGALPSGQCVAD